MDKLTKFFQVFSVKTWISLAAAFGLVLFPVYLFVQLADEVRDQETLIRDEQVLRTVNSFSSPMLDLVSVGFTQLGGVIGVFVLTLGIVLLLGVRRKRKSAAILAIGVTGAVLINVFLKTLFQRDRPELWERIVTENSYSFPSGHAMASSALALSLILVFWPTRWRWPVLIGSLLYMIGIGLTRLYLGVHYPTDIIAGWIVSAGWVALLMLIVRYRVRLSHIVKRISIDNR